MVIVSVIKFSPSSSGLENYEANKLFIVSFKSNPRCASYEGDLGVYGISRMLLFLVKYYLLSDLRVQSHLRYHELF